MFDAIVYECGTVAITSIRQSKLVGASRRDAGMQHLNNKGKPRLAPTTLRPGWRWRILLAALRSRRVFRLRRLDQVGAAEVIESVEHRVAREHIVFGV